MVKLDTLKKMPKLQRIKRSNGSVVFSVNLPLEIIEELDLKKGDNISLEIKEGQIIMALEEKEGGEING